MACLRVTVDRNDPALAAMRPLPLGDAVEEEGVNASVEVECALKPLEGLAPSCARVKRPHAAARLASEKPQQAPLPLPDRFARSQ